MTSRREFLQIGIAASALPLAAHAARAAGVPGLPGEAASVELYKVLYDRRIAASVAFARRGSALGVPAYAMDGDMTSFWYADLYHRWRAGPAAIAGLTAHGALFCLERLAWDQGMRVVFRAEHTPVDDGSIEHDFSGPVGMLREATAAVRGPGWSERLADVVLRLPSGKTEIGTARAATRGSLGMPADADSLYSWVIAPAASA